MAYQEKGVDIMSMIGKLGQENTRVLFRENIFNQPKTSADGAETIFQKLHQAASGEKDESTVIGKAAEVQISEAGRKLLEDDLDPLKKMCQTDFMTEGEKKLQELKDTISAREDYKKQAEKLQERIDTDTSLTFEEKARMQEEADALKEKGMSPDDKMHELYGKKHALEEKMESSEYMGEDVLLLQKQIALIANKIAKAENDIEKEGALKELYTQEIIKERGDIAFAKSRAKDLNATLDMRSSELSMAVRPEEQVAEQGVRNVTHQPRPEDIVQKAIEEGKERTEEGESIAPDKTMTAALDMQTEMQTTSATQNADDTSEELELEKKLKAMSLEDLLER